MKLQSQFTVPKNDLSIFKYADTANEAWKVIKQNSKKD